MTLLNGLRSTQVRDRSGVLWKPLLDTVFGKTSLSPVRYPRRPRAPRQGNCRYLIWLVADRLYFKPRWMKFHSKRLKSDEWLNHTRPAVLKRDNYKCQKWSWMGDEYWGPWFRHGGPLQVHHLPGCQSYGREWMTDPPYKDLKTLCRRCHQAEHGRWF